MELLLQGFDVVEVDVGISQNVHKLARLEAADLSHHEGEQRIGCDIEGDTQPQVRATLVHLAGQLPVGHEELQIHGWEGIH